MADQPWVTVNLGPAISELALMRQRAAHLRPVLDGPVANAVHEFFAKRFASGGAYGGDAWAPLSPATLRWRAAWHREAMPILRFTNDLWSSLTKRSSPLGYRIATDNSLTIGTSVAHAAFHQTGTATMPQREIVPDEVPAADTEQWTQLVVDYLEAA